MANRAMTELQNAPLPEVIKGLALAIGEAQAALDQNSIEQLRAMASRDEGIELDGQQRSLLELGMTPSFYHFTESTIEARAAFTLTQSREVSVSASLSVPIKVVMVSISASYTNKYSFEASGSSVISTKLVSVPPPQALTAVVERMASRLTLESKGS